jgi:hypothetical protein
MRAGGCDYQEEGFHRVPHGAYARQFDPLLFKDPGAGQLTYRPGLS